VLDLHVEAKRFRHAEGTTHDVLRGVRFTLRPGEVLALLAPSGTGKSTTLRIALGLDRDFRGSVRRAWRRAGVVFQEPRLLPWLSVADNIAYVQPHGAPPPDIAALLAHVGLPGMEARMPRTLSLGMARRVALVRALSVAPDLLVLDEPFASLDPRLSAELGERIVADARAAGAGVLLATHDLAQALALADRVLVLGGEPATLEGNVPVPAEVGARAALQTELLARFAFLRATAQPLDFFDAERNNEDGAQPHARD
jgi:ABC-type nitrate/sulfonate/bicarbonate transport system ATPase subunit